MAYGINFNNNSGAKILDGQHIIPQKLATFDMAYADQGYYDGTENDGVNCHPGYKMRRYWFTNIYSQQGRPVVYFWEFPDYQGQDIWICGHEIACDVMYNKNLSPANFTPPKVHVFGLDTVSQSGATTGLRAWNPDTGRLIYDSGNQHLAIQQIFPVGVDTTLGTDYPNANIQSYDDTLGWLPWDTNGVQAGVRGPAFTIPSRTGNVQYATRFGNEYEWEYAFFYRAHGRTIDTRCMRTAWATTGEQGSAPGYRYAPYTPASNMSVMAIAGANYR